MAKTSVVELCEFGQSVWIDNISRAMIKTGKINKMIESGVRGMTSNPTIFDKAISESNDYDEKIIELCKANKTIFEIYDELTVKDVQDAADIFLPVYNRSDRLDGYVSLEINPMLAHKTDETIAEGIRLFKKVNRPNVMFKIPATDEGFKAIEELTAEGLNINVTLIFSLAQYVNTVGAYLRGVKRRLKDKKDVSRQHSVASVFVSRIDTSVDSTLEAKGVKISLFKGAAARSNSALIYKKYLEIISYPDFIELRKKGANIQRVLWGSTGTKNKEYSDIKYVTELIAKDTVNTMPENTLGFFLDHGKVMEGLTSNVSGSQKVIDELKKIGIDVNDVCAQLLKEGVLAFEKSFESLLGSIHKKKAIISKK